MSNAHVITGAYVPSKSELRARTNLLVQIWRFAVLNVKMILMVSKGHH